MARPKAPPNMLMPARAAIQAWSFGFSEIMAKPESTMLDIWTSLTDLRQALRGIFVLE